jgi:hypothetical protein
MFIKRLAREREVKIKSGKMILIPGDKLTINARIVR